MILLKLFSSFTKLFVRRDKPEAATVFSQQTVNCAEDLVRHARNHGSVPISLTSAFVAALRDDLECRPADLSMLPVDARAETAYRSLTKIFNAPDEDECACYVRDHKMILKIGLGLASSSVCGRFDFG